MHDKQPATWKSFLANLYDDVAFTLEILERLGFRLAVFGSTLWALWTILRHLR